jgi:hypothetical protein
MRSPPFSCARRKEGKRNNRANRFIYKLANKEKRQEIKELFGKYLSGAEKI